MDYNQYNQTGNNKKQNYGLSIASMICGITSLVLCCVGLSIPLGSLGILLAILTRRKGQDMDALSITGIVTSVISLLLGLVMVISLLSDPELQQGFRDGFEQNYEESSETDFDKFMKEFYGNDFERFMEEYYGY